MQLRTKTNLYRHAISVKIENSAAWGAGMAYIVPITEINVITAQG